ncbi:MAG: Rieske 2Fe-2S domain-containing protein [Armatimonadetes bacterium]|nr:Rieske 2Fe-2S domain-containing protein [Armatimonadota bacterium]
MSASGERPRCPACRWQEDFPVDWESEQYVSRRELARFLTHGSGLLAAAGVALTVLGQKGAVQAYEPRRVCAVAEVPLGGSRLFRFPTEEDPCILVRLSSGEFRAYSQVCTNLACAVIHRPTENALFCPCHHGAFATETGAPTAGPPTRALPRVLLEERAGDLYAVGVEE